MTAQDLPTLNAILNAIATVFLIWGRMEIKKNHLILHKRLMITSLVFSGLFLISYLTYHYLFHLQTPYHRTGILKGIYLLILFTHIPLAAVVPPFAIRAVWLGLKDRREKHRRLVRWLWPVWVYVSATGVAIYLMLYVF